MNPQLYRIPLAAPGALATMARPRGGDPDRLAEDVEGLAAYGVNVLVSLLSPAEEDELGLREERAAALAAGLEFRRFEIPDYGVPPVAELREVADALLEQIRAGRTVVIHCRAGIGRSSLVLSLIHISEPTRPY